MRLDDKIFVAGHRGLVGAAVVRKLRALGYEHIVSASREQLDLEDPRVVSDFFRREQPSYVFLAAARVGGILANSSFPADFIRSNLAIQLNVIDAAHRSGVAKLLFFGSSCIYPKLAPQPIQEEYLLSGPLEPTNEPYAIAKIAGIKLCESYRSQHGSNFVSIMPTNLYGPGDNFELASSHVLPALVRKFHEAKLLDSSAVSVWGTGTPRREFLHVDDLADAAVFVMERYDEGQFLNVGSGTDWSIAELASMVREVVGYTGGVRFDPSKPDGTPRKLLDCSKIASLGWQPKIQLREGLQSFYEYYCGLETDQRRVR